MPQIFLGPSALSDFRRDALAEQLRAAGAAPEALRLRELFLVDGGEGETEALRALLGGPEPIERAALPARCRIATPRIGTLSPWSSKATDIARVCGLAARRIERARLIEGLGDGALPAAAQRLLFDPMTESLLADPAELDALFAAPEPRPLVTVPFAAEGRTALARANADWGLALSEEEIDYLAAHYAEAGRDPSDAELMMFAQINSEHCRHKIFNASFTIDGAEQPHSLFEMIRMTHAATPEGVLSAYRDNAAVVAGHEAMRYLRDTDGAWQGVIEPVHLLMKVETHNHPTGISPDPGAATGSGGEIRDEAATGRGARPKAGLCGFSVSQLRIPQLPRPWEAEDSAPANMASPLQIMLEAPIGAARYNNEFGRPNLTGYFRCFEQITADGRRRGYHKPIMIAGGYGNIREADVHKAEVPVDAALVVLGGPAMLIGLGGGAASSRATGSGDVALDFASVQRANPELQRRCQEVIDACWAAGEANPIVSIHDVGAGGLSNALPELIDADGRGGQFRLADVHCADPALSPMEIWCNESQERYVLAVAREALPRLEAFCERERCPMAMVGTATAEPQLHVAAPDGVTAIDMPMPVLLGKTPRMHRETARQPSPRDGFATDGIDFEDAALRVLRHPSVAAKDFLITIGDRTVGGLTVRDQMVGPWQVPVADNAITATGFTATTGEAMSMGERAPCAILDSAAAARMAVGEALTNLASAAPAQITDVRLSANWMAACGNVDEDARLYDAVRAVGAELCPHLGLAIPVGKDSLSMKSVWRDSEGTDCAQTAPVSLIVSAFAPVPDVRVHVTPQLVRESGTRLLLVEPGAGQARLGGSILAQCYEALGETPPDVDDPAALRGAFEGLSVLIREGRILACHDRSDGGLLATLAEMAFAGRVGVNAQLQDLHADPVASAFCEELGWVVQVHAVDAPLLCERLPGCRVTDIGAPMAADRLRITHGESTLLDSELAGLEAVWSETTHAMARLRDQPAAADTEQQQRGDREPLRVIIDEEPIEAVPALALRRPRVAILREQGVNGHVEMAWAFDAAGFEPVDVHMSELLAGARDLSDFQGLVACGGFSYGDVLGAGQGWARSVLFHEAVRQQFADFFADDSRFALGVCNGCQMLAALAEIIPGSENWPSLAVNASEQFEARWSQILVPETRSLFFDGMAGAMLPVAVAHGEGRMVLDKAALQQLDRGRQVVMRYGFADGSPAERYPVNPNGSPQGLTGVCNADGRVTILMPHPERTVAGTTGSWWPRRDSRFTPWMQIFRNARRWVG
ncbi:phosphoribosylformylglycinamidine synthase [Algiphilus aromaticivorans]|uniref:phosphoribosylformylglycinamidine synthase n=1 Tax=Algiphilus aromaticivorans TaxID=382454 RepID=UPI0005C18136|nr:phosphoribosylformylglycinamidine synthase [Algiphilus aromaticivorans]